MGANAFYECTSLENIYISGYLKEISKGLFENCKSLKKIIIPDTVEKISENAFAGCTALNLTIPDFVKLIQYNAFKNVPHIEYHGIATGAPWGAKSMN